MMNGRQRWTFGISSHDSGRTIRKKIANVAVGKSIGRAYSTPSGEPASGDDGAEGRSRGSYSSGTGLERDERRRCDRRRVDPVLGVDLGLAAGLSEPVDTEGHAANAESAADERRGRGLRRRSPSRREGLSRSASGGSRDARSRPAHLAAVQCCAPASPGRAGRATRGRGPSPRPLLLREQRRLPRAPRGRSRHRWRAALGRRSVPARAGGSRRLPRPPAGAPRRAGLLRRAKGSWSIGVVESRR